MTEIKRLHISGLNPTQCSIQDLHSRFQSFQLQVRDVHNWPPGKDGVGNVQNWCFLTVEGDSSKIKRATDLLNGTIWKGSKLRIGSAKKEAWVEEEKVVVTGSEVDAEKKKKKKKKSRGVESERLSRPITTKDVEEGEWGWKKTPAGHLLRPLHMRPPHAIPRPTAGPSKVEEKDIEKEKGKEKKRKRKASDHKPMTRARRVTIDPSRYGAIHLSGLVLSNGTEDFPDGSQWECEEDEDEYEKSQVKWILKDSQGNVLKEEYVQLRKEQATLSASESGSESNSESEEEDSSMDEVAAAINNAASDSSSSESDREESGEQESYNVIQPQKAQTFQFPSFDPGEESDFSDGYQEVQLDARPQPLNLEEEKAGHLGLLRNMFGSEVLSTGPPPLTPIKVWPEEDESEEEDKPEEAQVAPPIERSEHVEEPAASGPLTGAQKRAALLSRTKESGVEPKSFQPMVRFDPGTSDVVPDIEAEEVQQAKEVESDEESAIQNNSQSQTSIVESMRADRVEMTSLKDMFRPKEASASFTLMGDLDLDLEEEDEDEEEELGESEETQTRPIQNRWITEPVYVTPTPSSSDNVPFFVPLFEEGDRSWLSILQKDPTVSKFYKDKTDEELQEQWKERKGQLTQEYKRRHREALKKKKRKYTGSRAAGTSMPSRS